MSLNKMKWKIITGGDKDRIRGALNLYTEQVMNFNRIPFRRTMEDEQLLTMVFTSTNDKGKDLVVGALTYRKLGTVMELCEIATDDAVKGQGLATFMVEQLVRKTV